MNPIRTVVDNGRTYVVSLDVHAMTYATDSRIPGALPRYLWYSRNLVTGRERPGVIQGVVLTGYLVTVDDDPSWRAVVRLDGQPVTGWQDDDGQTVAVDPGSVHVSQVTISRGRDGLTITTLPIRKLLRACIACGAVAGRLQPDGSYKVIVGEDGYLIPPAQVRELAGERRRPRASTEERNREISRLLAEFRKHKAAGTLPKGIRNQPDYIVEKYRCVPGTAPDYIKAARQWEKAQQSNATNTEQGDTQ